MVLVDTSAWIEFLRDTGSAACVEVDRLLGRDDEIAVSDPIRMEILTGARDEQHLRDLRGLLARAQVIAVLAEDFDAAATLYRTCRSRGDTVRKLIDCMIGATAIRGGTPVLHADSDFDVLARHTDLVIHTGP